MNAFFVFQIRQLPESVIVETTEYKCLQSQFSVLYNESMQLKTSLDECRVQLQTCKNTHLRQIEMMEVSISFFPVLSPETQFSYLRRTTFVHLTH